MNVALADRGRAQGVVLTILAMLCFAANSVLCRLALGLHLIDPASFTTIRVISAAIVLVVMVGLSGRPLANLTVAKWRSIAALLAYLISFSFAYTRLATGTGALILFGAVQLTMFAVAGTRRCVTCRAPRPRRCNYPFLRSPRLAGCCCCRNRSPHAC